MHGPAGISASTTINSITAKIKRRSPEIEDSSNPTNVASSSSLFDESDPIGAVVEAVVEDELAAVVVDVIAPTEVGARVGLKVGEIVGSYVGAIVGSNVGAIVGSIVGV